MIVRREVCSPAAYPVVRQQTPGRRLVREIVRQIPQPAPTTAQPAYVCVPQQQQQQQIITQPQTVQQLVPVFATRQVSFSFINERARDDSFLLIKNPTSRINLPFVYNAEWKLKKTDRKRFIWCHYAFEDN